MSAQIPEGAVVLSPNKSGWCECVYRLGDYVVKVLRDRITPEMVRRRMGVAAMYPELCEPFEYDAQTHTIRQRYLGDEPPSASRIEALKAAAQRNWHDNKILIYDIEPRNVRGGKLIDFRALQEL